MGTIHCAPTILYSFVGAWFIMPVVFQYRLIYYFGGTSWGWKLLIQKWISSFRKGGKGIWIFGNQSNPECSLFRQRERKKRLNSWDCHVTSFLAMTIQSSKVRMRVKAQNEILVGCSKRKPLKNVLVLSR